MLELAALAAATLVAAMTTSAWEAASTGITKLFTRTDTERQDVIQAQLKGDVDRIESASDPDQTRAVLAGFWETKLGQLLEGHRDAEDELRALIQKVRCELPPAQETWVQNNNAHAGGTVFAAQGNRAQVVAHASTQANPEFAPGESHDAGDGS
jgi:hypothetical protein